MTRTRRKSYRLEPLDPKLLQEPAVLTGLATDFRAHGTATGFTDVPKTPDELHEWVVHYLNVRIPRTRCCGEHVSPFEAFAAAYFAVEPIVVWHASRGFGGKSFLLATLTLTEAITLGAACNLLGGSGEQSKRVHSYLTGEDPNVQGQFWDSPHAPTELIASDPTKQEMRLTNGAVIKALMASGTSVRGPHPQRLRLDECDEMHIDIFDSALGQPMGARGIESQTVCSSTHHIPEGTMTEILKRAGENDWPVFEWCYRENLEPHGWLAESEIAKKKKTVTKKMWNIEYELQEPSPEDRAIDTESVKWAFEARLGVYRGDQGERNEIRLVEPYHLRQFYHAADWAKSSDWTIVHSMEDTGDDSPDRLAAWSRLGRLPWPIMVKHSNKRVKRYGGKSAHDATGVGEVVHDYLEVRSLGFDFRHAKDRAEMLSSYIAALENREFIYPMIQHSYREHLYATVGDIYGAGYGGGHLPDTIAAAALARHAKLYGMGEYEVGSWDALTK